MTTETIEELEKKVENYERADETSRSNSWEQPLEDAREELLDAKQSRVEELERYVSAAILAPKKREPAKEELAQLKTEVEELEVRA